MSHALYLVSVHELLRTPDGVVLTPEHIEPVRPDADGIASPDGRPCEALSVSGGRRCPKPSAVLLSIRDEPMLALCGGHFGVHRAGKRLTLPERPAP